MSRHSISTHSNKPRKSWAKTALITTLVGLVIVITIMRARRKAAAPRRKSWAKKTLIAILIVLVVEIAVALALGAGIVKMVRAMRQRGNR